MIYVTRLNHKSVVLNSDLIEHIETTPDTVISLTNGQKLMVLESAEEVVARVVEFRRRVLAVPMVGCPPTAEEPAFAVESEPHGRR
jgi:flagellar protein FlbD